jgi:hypothetical protein
MRVFASFLFGALLGVSPALAGDSDFPFTINIDFNPPSYSGCADPGLNDSALSCGAIDNDLNDYDGAPNFGWLLVGGIPEGTGGGAPGGIGGIQFGISYDETFVVGSWTLCTGGSQIPQDDLMGTWPESGTGNAATWAGGCHLVDQNPDGLTAIGFLEVDANSNGVIDIMGDPRIGEALAADCAASALRICDQLLGRGFAFGGGERAGEGVTCGFMCAVPTRSTSWGAIKSLF